MASLIAGGALAAPGGNGKGVGLGQGKGLALAKGHAKHDPVTPQLDPATPQLDLPPAAGPEAEPNQSARQPSSGPAALVEKTPPPGEATREHVTICHATGSGRYIVISPNVNGVENGHLGHHDDFVYQGSCARGQAPSPPPDEPAPPPTAGGHPPRDEAGGVSGIPAVRPSGDLPFTGMPALPLGLLGGALVFAGVLVARRKSS